MSASIDTTSNSSITKDANTNDVDTSFKFANKTLQDYEVISVIGNGTFGTCFKVRDKRTGELYAWKGIDYDELSETKKESLVSEISVLRQLQHPNIVQYYHHLVNHEAKSIFIVMECCEGGDLAQLIAKARLQRKRFEERYIWRVLFQICKALQVCHNKIKKGTILHRDIKPANIFLDAQGNVKLGDFGLARMLRRNECFAETFVGTPYYMSPELVKGSKYDRKSDVWAVGCLIYEMCALSPPFRAREFEQLTVNISNGQFSHIPEVYSTDLQQIIAYMLEVDSEQRPSIEVITRHPNVVRNITDLRQEFPTLLIAEKSFYAARSEKDIRCSLQFSPIEDMSSTMFTEQNSFNEEYGQRRLSGTFTPDLRAELFYSIKQRSLQRSLMQRSDPELYESIRPQLYATVDITTDEIALRPPAPPPRPATHSPNAAAETAQAHTNPDAITDDVFHEALQERLHAIRAQEFLLQQREASLEARAHELTEKEKRLQQLESNLQKRQQELEIKENALCEQAKQKIKSDNIENQAPPPIPPRKSSKQDDTYCSIEDTILEQPTMAKLNLHTLTAGKALSTLRRVTFQSPNKFIKYDIENIPATPVKKATSGKDISKLGSSSTQMLGSVSSKESQESADSAGTATTATSAATKTASRRKSILAALFGLHRSKDNAKSNVPPIAQVAAPNAHKSSVIKERLPFMPRDDQVLAKCETAELTNIWTKEHKRAAFDLLAAMNAGQVNSGQVEPTTIAAAPATTSSRHKFRQSTRERHGNTLRRHNHMRRSLMVAPPHTQTFSVRSGVSGHEKMLV